MKQEVSNIDGNKFLKKHTFWHLPDGAKLYAFNKFELAEYLESIGVFRYYTTKTDYILIRIIDNVVDYIDIATIKHLVIDYVKQQKDGLLLISLQKKISDLINPTSIENVKRKDIDFFTGEKDAVYVFYSDCIAVERKGSAEKIQYKDFHGVIWKSHILKRKYPDESRLTDAAPGEFEQFFNHIFQDAQNKRYARQVFGYVMHRYKNLANMRMIILNDDNVEDMAKGGTGKGIIYQCFKQFLPGVKENGKAYRPNRTFSFQNIKQDTGICFIDDVPPNFDITQLFSVVTDGLFVEYKNQTPFWIDATNAPLFMISSNYGVKGSDDSHLRRRYDLGLDKYYDAKKTPETEFGHQLFREWEPESIEWVKFDLFMLECANMYISNGVQVWENPKLKEKQLIADTHLDFYDHMMGKVEKAKEENETVIVMNKETVVDELKKMTGNNKFTKTRATQWIKKFTDYEGLEFENDRIKDTWTITL
jgi:hypothetical protein